VGRRRDRGDQQIGVFLFLPFYRFWCILVIVVDVGIIWALVTARQPQTT